MAIRFWISSCLQVTSLAFHRRWLTRSYAGRHLSRIHSWWYIASGLEPGHAGTQRNVGNQCAVGQYALWISFLRHRFVVSGCFVRRANEFYLVSELDTDIYIGIRTVHGPMGDSTRNVGRAISRHDRVRHSVESRRAQCPQCLSADVFLELQSQIPSVVQLEIRWWERKTDIIVLHCTPNSRWNTSVKRARKRRGAEKSGRDNDWFSNPAVVRTFSILLKNRLAYRWTVGNRC